MALQANDSPPAKAERRLTRAFRHGNFRRYYMGQGVSLLGTWMQQTALIWLVFRLTDDPFWVGLCTFASHIPWLLLLPVAGVLLDRWNLLRAVMVTQALAMGQAFLMAGLVLAGTVDVGLILALTFALGCVNAFDLPARQALLPELLSHRADLSNAIALNSSLFNGARLVGPALAGLMAGMVEGGEGWCFLLNGLSFLAVLWSLTRLTPGRKLAKSKPLGMHKDLWEGLTYAWGQPPIRAVLFLIAAVGLLVMPYTVLVPIIAKDILAGDSLTYGLLLGSSGLGALCGGLYLATRPTIRGSGSRIAVAGAAAAVSLAALALSYNFALSLALIFLAGLSVMMLAVTCNTIVQSIVPDDMRGRTLSLYSLAFLGLTPIGALMSGAIASSWGPAAAMVCCASGCLLAVVLFLPRLGVVRGAIRSHVSALKQASAPDPQLSPDMAGEMSQG